MAGYQRQSAADIVPTAVVRAAPINNELNALRDAFLLAGGHRHDGSATEGNYVTLIADSDALNKVVVDTANNRVGVFVEVAAAAVEQVRVQDGAIVPVTTNDVDLGTSSVKFKDLHLAGTATIPTANIGAGAITATTLTVTGTVDVTNTVISNVSTPTLSSDAATKGYVDTAVANLIDGAPGTIDTLNELAAALGDDPAFATTVTNSIAAKLPLAGGTMSGNIAMGGNKVTGLGTPTTGSDATNKTYIDTLFGSTASAAASAAAAATSETNAAASYDSFDDRYLGAKASAPAVDNDGNALLTGALYWNSTSSNLFVWTGSAWSQAAFTAGTFATLTGTETLTNKTLTAPAINLINDTSGNEVLNFSPTASAVDYVTVQNGIGVATPLHIYADGPSANIGLHLQPKGTGLITISDGTDFNKGIRFRSSSSAASAVTLLDAVSTAGRVITLPDATTTLVGRDTTDTLTNKTIAFGSNTFSGANSPANGGTGVANNAAMTVTGSGNFAYTRTLTGATNVTFPVTGTLATLAGTETLTNKTIAFGSNTFSGTNSPVNGGTGVANNAAMTVTGSGNFAYTRTLTGATNVTFPTTGTLATLAGTETLTNKTIAFGSNTLSDVASLSTSQTFTGTKTFSGTSSAKAIVLNDAAEVATVSATAATGTIAYDITTQSVLYYTSNASANWTVNFRGSSGTSLNTLMATGESMTVAFLVTQGATAYYNSAVQVDGTTSGVTTRWLGGAPTAGNASGIDSYRYLIIKTGSATFTVLASNTQFKA